VWSESVRVLTDHLSMPQVAPNEVAAVRATNAKKAAATLVRDITSEFSFPLRGAGIFEPTAKVGK
jgi:hypothetical protein